MTDFIIAQMRQLKLEFDGGRIDEATYLARFQEINASVGIRCQRCKQGTATIWRASVAICAACELGMSVTARGENPAA